MKSIPVDARKADRRFIHETLCHWRGELNNANAFLPPKLASLRFGVCERALITIAWSARAKAVWSQEHSRPKPFLNGEAPVGVQRSTQYEKILF